MNTNYLLFRFIAFMRQKGLSGDAYIVGGAVRDILLDRPIRDIDVAVKGEVMELAKEFAFAIDGVSVTLDEEFSVSRIVKDGQYLDISRLRCDSLFIDLADRDLTINAMAIPLERTTDIKRSLIDVFNGADDISRGIIRMVSEENFIKDPLRIIRVFRFAATLNFEIEDETLQTVKNLAPLINSSAYERIAEELRHILLCPHSARIIELMAETKTLTHIFGMNFSSRPTRDYKLLESILNGSNKRLEGLRISFDKYTSLTYRLIAVKFIILFEDAEYAIKAANMLKMSRKETGLIRVLTERRDIFASLFEERATVDSEGMIRFLYDTGDDIYGIILILAASDSETESSFLEFVLETALFYEGAFKERCARLPLITGNDIKEAFVLPTSPIYKEILMKIDLMALSGSIHTKDDALNEARRMIQCRLTF